jgi:uncharacterized protein (DUF58 family)
VSKNAPAFAYGALLDAVRGVTWPARRRASGTLPGSHRSNRRSAAVELSEFRAYRQGDEPKGLDWKLLARTDRAFVRLADERAVLRSVLVVDASASMAFPEGARSKWEYARAIAIALASIAHAAGDPVGAVVAAGDGVRVVEPRSRAGTVAQLAQGLAGKADGRGDLVGALRQVQHLLAGRVVVLSDFLSDEEDVRRIARELVAGGVEVHGVHIVAAEELDPGTAPALYADPEDPAQRHMFNAGARAEYRERFAHWRQETARSWRLAGASWTGISTAETPACRWRGVPVAPAAPHRPRAATAAHGALHSRPGSDAGRALGAVVGYGAPGDTHCNGADPGAGDGGTALDVAAAGDRTTGTDGPIARRDGG